MEAVWVAAAMVQFGKADSQSILIHIDCGASIPSLVVLKTDVVKRILEEGFSEELVQEAAKGSILWHDASQLAHRLWAYRTAGKLSWARAKDEIISGWREQGFEVWGSRYKLKEVRCGMRRVDAEIVLTTREPVTKRLIRGVLKHATRKLRRRFVPANSETGLRVPRMPLHVCFRVHARNRTTRILGLNGWSDPENLAQAEWRARKSLKPLWVKLPDEETGGVLIRYNPHLTVAEG
jgi:hypothetical protein